MFFAFVAIIVGLVLLVLSADRFIDGAVGIATKYHMPKMLIGALIIGIGTSAPEMVVSALSALAGSPGIALGNAYGSNIVNILLVLGVTALITPIAIHKDVLKTDFAWLIAATVLSFLLIMDGDVSRMDALILLLSLVTNIIAQIYTAKKHTKSNKDDQNTHADDDLPNPNEVSLGLSLFRLIIGLFVMIGSSRLIVWGAVELATLWGLSDLIIGLTIVAIGTSLPELISSIIAARRGEFDLALGNVLGSNVFNTLAVVGVAGIISPMAVSAEILNRDILVMCASTIALFVLCAIALKGHGKLGRGVGVVFVSCFVAYSAWLAVSALG